MAGRHWLIVVTAIVLIFIAGFLCVWLRPATTLVFQLPTGFTGPFILVEDPVGVPLRASQGSITVRVPSSRIAVVRSFDPLLKDWSRIIAITPEREFSYLDDQSAREQPQQFALRGFRFLRESDGRNEIRTFEFCLSRSEHDVPGQFQRLRDNWIRRSTTNSS